MSFSYKPLYFLKRILTLPTRQWARKSEQEPKHTMEWQKSKAAAGRTIEQSNLGSANV
jgi:hypothetical protein